MRWKGVGGGLQGAQPMPSRCPPDAKCQRHVKPRTLMGMGRPPLPHIPWPKARPARCKPLPRPHECRAQHRPANAPFSWRAKCTPARAPASERADALPQGGLRARDRARGGTGAAPHPKPTCGWGVTYAMFASGRGVIPSNTFVSPLCEPLSSPILLPETSILKLGT